MTCTIPGGLESMKPAQTALPLGLSPGNSARPPPPQTSCRVLDPRLDLILKMGAV